MFIVIISFPPIRQGHDAEFQEWFGTSNKEFCKLSGFISRKLLQPVDGGNYAAIMEFVDEAAFKTMQSSPAHAEAGRQVKALLDGQPKPTFYQLVVG